MKILKMLKYIFVLLLLLSSKTLCALNQERPDSLDQPIKGIQFSSKEEAEAFLKKRKLPFFSGISVTFDLAGAIMASASSWGQLESSLRLNLKGSYFPVFELGYGISDHKSDATDLTYKTKSPFFRVGCDYNFSKDKTSPNRFMVGLRYGFTKFNFDLSGPPVVDPLGGGFSEFIYSDLNSSVHWGELVGGLETRIWSFFHLGWSIRYKFRLHQDAPTIVNAWYVPGFGKNSTSCLGGTLNLIFDI